MQDGIDEAMFEFAKDVQALVERGWTFGEIKYSERRLGIGPSITVSKGDKTQMCYSHHAVGDILREEYFNEEMERVRKNQVN